jgi:opacity protein-like surface antigen
MRKLILSLLALVAVGLAPAFAETIKPPRKAAPAAAAPFPEPVQNVFADAPVAKLSWTGFYIGGFAGYGAAVGELSHIGPPPVSFDGIGGHGALGGGTVGFDWQVNGSCLVLGVRGNYAFHDVQSELNIGPGSIAGRMNDGWSADGRIGCAMGTALPYVFGGWGRTGFDLTDGSTTEKIELDGHRAGAGVEWRLRNLDTGVFKPTLAIEVMRRQHEAIKFDGGDGKFEIVDYSGMLRLNLRAFDGYK